METEDHATNPYIGLFNGLRFIFSDLQLPQEKFEKGLSEIDKYYKSISSIYAYEIKAPENVIIAVPGSTEMLNLLRSKNYIFQSGILLLPSPKK